MWLAPAEMRRTREGGEVAAVTSNSMVMGGKREEKEGQGFITLMGPVEGERKSRLEECSIECECGVGPVW